MMIDSLLVAPSISDLNTIMDKNAGGESTFDEVVNQKGVLIFTQPHHYGIALMELNKMMEGKHKDRILEAFNHEVDHFNRAQEHGRESVLGIMFGVDGRKISSDGTLSITNFAWVGFEVHKKSTGENPEIVKLIENDISGAPIKLSTHDKRRLEKVN